MFGDKNKNDHDRDRRNERDRDEVKELANHMSRDLYVGTDGFVRTSAPDTISSNMANENANSRGSSGGCGQSSDNVKDSDSGDRSK